MSIYLIAVDKHPPAWVAQAVTHYQHSIPEKERFELISVASATEKNQSWQAGRQQEAKHLIKAIPDKSYVIALVIEATAHDSLYWAKTIKTLASTHKNLCLLIGGSYGLDSACLQRADQQWSLSPLTFSHNLARVLAAEQLFRSWAIEHKHPYHQ